MSLYTDCDILQDSRVGKYSKPILHEGISRLGYSFRPVNCKTLCGMTVVFQKIFWNYSNFDMNKLLCDLEAVTRIVLLLLSAPSQIQLCVAIREFLYSFTDRQCLLGCLIDQKSNQILQFNLVVDEHIHNTSPRYVTWFSVISGVMPKTLNVKSDGTCRANLVVDDF